MSVTLKFFALVVLLLSVVGCVHSGSGRIDVQQVFALRAEADELYEGGRYAEALVVYQELAKHMPKHPQTWLRIGNCQAQLGRYGAAEAAYREALVHDSEFSRAWLNLAFVQAQQLADTVVAMYAQVPAGDPESRRIYTLVEGVLAPFDILVQPQQSLSAPALHQPDSQTMPGVGNYLADEEVDTDEQPPVE